MGKFSFVAGVGVGYLLGARAGRQQFEKIRSAGQQVWQDPRVQTRVHRVEERVTQVARDQASAMTDKVAEGVKSRIAGTNGGSTGRSNGDGSNGDDDQMRPTPPQPEV